MTGTSGVCRQRNHARCTRGYVSCACECHALDALASDAYRIDDADVRAFLGERGDWHGRAYVWCVRGQHYHVEALGDAVRGTRGIPNGSYAGRERTLPRRAPRTRQPRATVRTYAGTLAADAIVARAHAGRIASRAYGHERG